MRRRLVVVLVVVLAALAAAAGSSLGSTRARSVLLQGNLLQNPGAEAGSCSADGSTPLPIPGWVTSGSFTVACYGGQGLPTAAFASSIGGGQNMFYGGEEPTTTATQSVDVSAEASGIDSGVARANLSAYLGGYASQDDNMVITAAFLSSSGSALGSPLQIGPVTAADRASATELRQRSASAAVPAGTRSIRVTMTATRTEGFFNDATADNLSLTLTATNGYGRDCPVPPLPSPSLVNLQDTWVLSTVSSGLVHGPVSSFADHKRQLRRLTADDEGRAPAARVPSPGLPSLPGSWTGAGYLSATVACGTGLDKTLENVLHAYQAGDRFGSFFDAVQMNYLGFRGRLVYSISYYHVVVVGEDRSTCNSLTGTSGHPLFCVRYTLQYERRKAKTGSCTSRSKAGCTTRRRP